MPDSGDASWAFTLRAVAIRHYAIRGLAHSPRYSAKGACKETESTLVPRKKVDLLYVPA